MALPTELSWGTAEEALEGSAEAFMAVETRIEGGEDIILVDVREKDEWRQGYIPGAVHVPHQQEHV